jgi:hypothetical protein
MSIVKKPVRHSGGFGLSHLRGLLFLVVVFCGNAYAAPPAGGSLDVAIRALSGHDSVPVSGVYLALVALDQPANRPTIEAMVDGAAKWQRIPAGRYVLMAEAPSFYPAQRNIEIGDGRSDQVAIELHPQFELTGIVVDAKGRPVKGATVRTPRIVPPTLLGNLSSLARQHAAHMWTTTDENGWWKLEVPVKGSSMLVEAPGYEAAWVTWDPKNTSLPPITLQRGSSLRVLTNRPVPELVLTIAPSTRIETSIPADWQDRVWARDAGTTAIEWKSQPAGDYDLVASWPDPRRFTAPVTLRRVTLSGNDSKEIRITLPDTPSLVSKSVRVLVPWQTITKGLRAFTRTASGTREVPAASENVFGGRVLYANADAAPEDVFFTTDGEVILGAKRGRIEENQEQGPAVEGIKFPKAEGTLKVSVSEPAPLPSHGNARFDECQGDKSYMLPVNVRKNGEIALPLLVGCHALTMRFESFSPVVARMTARPREQVWLGTHHLKAAASVQIHVIHKSDGTNVPEALVTAFVNRGPGDLVAAAKQVAGGNGWLVMDGLPVGEEITFRAEDSTKLAGTVTRTFDPGKREVIDPLPLPESGSLTVIPRFEDDFKNKNADAVITTVIAEGENGGKPDRRSAELTRDQQEAVFPGLNPGSWRILALVRLGDLTQPVDVTAVTIESGDKKKLEPVIQPLVVSGHLTSHGHGVKASIAFTDPPGPGAIVRRVMSKEDGAFRTMLTRPGFYAVAARRSPSDPDTELAPIQFDETSENVQIELPVGSLSVRVFSGGKPAPDVQITASMLGGTPQSQPEQSQLVQFERRDTTNSIGETLLDELQDGTWLVRARGKDETVAEKTIAVSASSPASVSLDLDGGSTLVGTVVDGAGNPAGMAEVDCIYSGSDHIPRIGYVETDSWGKFSMHFPEPAPERLRCGVTTVDGAIGTFVTAPVSDAQFTLPAGTSMVTITNWSDRASRDRFWLIAADGGLFDLSWAAHELRKMDAPFTIPRVPAGAWSVVRVDSAGAFDVLASGGGAALPQKAQIRLGPGEHKEINMQSGDTSGKR